MVRNTREKSAKALSVRVRAKKEETEKRRALRKSAGELIASSRYFKITKLSDVKKMLCKFALDEYELPPSDARSCVSSATASSQSCADSVSFGQKINREAFMSAMRCIGLCSPKETRAVNRLFSSFDLDLRDVVEIDDVISFFFYLRKQQKTLAFDRVTTVSNMFLHHTV